MTTSYLPIDRRKLLALSSNLTCNDPMYVCPNTNFFPFARLIALKKTLSTRKRDGLNVWDLSFG